MSDESFSGGVAIGMAIMEPLLGIIGQSPLPLPRRLADIRL